MSRLDRLRKLKQEMEPHFEAYAKKHNGVRPCVEGLIIFLINEEFIGNFGQYKCPTCRSEGFEVSTLKDQCTFCDGTAGGHPPQVRAK